MEYPFGHQPLWVLQPGHIPANRAKYQIFSGRLELLASAVGIERRGLPPGPAPSTPALRAPTSRTQPSLLEIVGVEGEPLLRMTRRHKEWTAEFRDSGGALVGTIRTGNTWRRYTFLNESGRVIAKIAGDPGLRNFSVSAANGRELASVSRTRAGLFQEMSAPNDHYRVDFSGTPAPHSVRILTVMMPFVLDRIPGEDDDPGSGKSRPASRKRGPDAREPDRLPVSIYLDDETDSEQVEAAIDVSLRPTRDAVHRVGSLLIVKADWAVGVHRLTAGQRAALDRRPELLSSPHEIISALGLAEPEEAGPTEAGPAEAESAEAEVP